MENTVAEKSLTILDYPKKIGKRLEQFQLRPSYFLRSEKIRNDSFFKQRDMLLKQNYGYTALHRHWSKLLTAGQSNTLPELNTVKIIVIMLDEKSLLETARELGISFFANQIIPIILKKEVLTIKEKLGNALYEKLFENYDNFKMLESVINPLEWSVNEILESYEQVGWLALQNIFSSSPSNLDKRFNLRLPSNLNLENLEKLNNKLNFSNKKIEAFLTTLFRKAENPWLLQLIEAH